jgi:hypothetical protein
MNNKRSGVLISLVAGWIGLISVATAQPLHQISSEVCKSCHKEIYKQWKGSMHASSSALTDPIHGTFYKKVAGEPTEEGVLLKASGKYPVCLQCHAPNAAKDKTTKLDANPIYAEGVNCTACHTLKKFNGIQGADGKLQLGLKAYDVSPDTVQGPGRYSNRGLEKLAATNDVFGGGAMADESKPNPHLGKPVTMDGKEIPSIPMESNPTLLRTSDACMGCHDQRNNPHGVPLCQTGNEYTMSESKVNCLSCHMPINDGLADHTMGGGHNEAILRRSVVFDVTTEQAGDKIKATVLMKNLQPHSLPTGAPFRNIYMMLKAYDADGNVVWENAKKHPAKEDPQAYLQYSMADEAGNPASPDEAVKLGKDTRLKPHEERTIAYEIPANGVKLVRGELYYNLLWPGLVQKFSHLPQDLTAPTLIASAEKAL